MFLPLSCADAKEKLKRAEEALNAETSASAKSYAFGDGAGALKHYEKAEARQTGVEDAKEALAKCRP
jgi:hypothetical protein